MSGFGLKSDDCSDWADGFRNIGRFEASIIQELLFRTPAIGCSALSSGFIERTRCLSSDAAEAMARKLTEGIPLVKEVGSAEELSKVLRSFRLLEGAFWESNEFIVMYTRGSEKHVSRAVDQIVPKGSGYEVERKNIVRARLSWLDALFRHVRNALAHGLFSVRETPMGQVVVFQDRNANGEISSRMVISSARLRDWISELKRLEQTGV